MIAWSGCRRPEYGRGPRLETHLWILYASEAAWRVDLLARICPCIVPCNESYLSDNMTNDSFTTYSVFP